MINGITLVNALCNNVAFLSGGMTAVVTISTLMACQKIFNLHVKTRDYSIAVGFALGAGGIALFLCHSIVHITAFSLVEFLQIGCVAAVIGFMLHQGFKSVGIHVPAYVGSAPLVIGAILGTWSFRLIPSTVVFGVVGAIVACTYGYLFTRSDEARARVADLL